MPYSLATLWLQTGQPLLSDAAVKIIAEAGTTMALIFLMALGLWVVIRPLVNSRAAKDSANDAVTDSLLTSREEARADSNLLREDLKKAHEDNSRMLDVIEKKIESDGKIVEAMQAQSASTDKLAAAIQATNTTTMSFLDVAVGQSNLAIQHAQQLPGVLQLQHNKSVEEVKTAMTQAFELRDEKFQTILNRLNELETKFGANERVTEEMKLMVAEVRDLLRAARPVDKPDTDSLAGKTSTGPDALRTSPTTGTGTTGADVPSAGPATEPETPAP